MDFDERYDCDHFHGTVKFYLSSYAPDKEQCRILMLKVLEQAVRDYCSLFSSELPNERLIWAEARDFLYDNDYLFNWGKLEFSLEEWLDMIDLDVEWVREATKKRFNLRNKR